MQNIEQGGLLVHLKALRRRAWIICVVVAVGVGVALWLASRSAPVYGASAEVAVNQQSLPAGLLGGSSTSAQSLQRDVETQASVAAGPVVAELVLRALPQAHWTATQLLGHVSVTPSPAADLLEVQVTAPTKALASVLATTYADVYAKYRLGQQTAAIDAVLADLQSKIVAARAVVAAETKAKGQPITADRQQVFVLLNQKQTMTSLKTSLKDAVQVIRPGDNSHQVQPRPLRSGLLGGIAGLALGLLLAFTLDALDTRLRDADQVAGALGVPMLVRIPRIPRRLRKQRVTSLASYTDAHTEAYRMLKTAVDLATLRSSARTLMISSAVAGEGKSTVSANLAVVAAAAGRRVVLVDLDLRKPTIAGMFGLSADGRAVSDVVRGSCELSRALQRVPIDRHFACDGSLTVLAANRLDTAPSALLESDQLRATIRWLREEFDLVIIDTPPLLAVSDAGVIATSADAMLVVVRPSIIKKPVLADLAKTLKVFDLPTIGFGITGAVAKHGYGYGYGYGYGNSSGRPAEGGPGSKNGTPVAGYPASEAVATGEG